MRHNWRSPALILVAVAALLAGCDSTGSTPGPTGTSQANTEDLQAIEDIKVTGPLDEKPTITLPGHPFRVSTTVARMIKDGKGEALESGQLLTFNELSVNDRGEEQATTWGQEPASEITVGKNDQFGNMDEILADAHVGARFLIAIPTDMSDVGPQGTSIVVVDILKATTVLTRASGSSVTIDPDLPAVTLAADGAPVLTPVAGEPPTELVVQPLIDGDGPKLEQGQTVIVKYTGWLWDGTSFDTSWGGTPDTFKFVLDIGAVVPGWDQALLGQTVGSQLLMVVPPELGYGDEGNGSVPGGATMVFVVDILAAP